MSTPAQAAIPIRALVVVIAIIGAFAVTIGVGAPLTSLILEQRGESATTIGLLNAVPAIGTFLIALSLPALLRRYGMRWVLLVSLGIEMAAFIAMPIFDSLAAWFFIRLVMGATGGALFISSETWINTLTANVIRGRVTAIYGIVMGISFALGPLIIYVTGTGNLPFWIAAAFVFVAILLVLRFQEQGLPQIHEKSSFGVLAFVLMAPVLTASIFVCAWKEVTVWGLLPVYAVRSGLGESDGALLVSAFAAGVVALQYPIGWISDKINRYAVLGVCVFTTGVGVAMMPWYIGSAYVWFFVALWGGLSSGIYTVPMAIVGDRFRGAELATAMSCFGTLWAAGSLFGPFLTGRSMDVFSKDGFAATMAIICMALLLLLLVRRLVFRPSPDDRQAAAASKFE